VSLYHCDLQGPFDTAHLIWGTDIFSAIYDCPELVHALLGLVTEGYLRVLELEKASIGEGKDTCLHWGLVARGGTVIREDSATLLSPAAYQAFAAPYTARILKAWGGVIHFCGNGHHLWELMTRMDGLTGVNLGNPERYDLAQLVARLEPQRLNVVGWGLALTPAQRAEHPTGLTLNPTVSDVSAARVMWREHVAL
jgi:uroporphyrinogen-III decarboxylase